MFKWDSELVCILCSHIKFWKKSQQLCWQLWTCEWHQTLKKGCRGGVVCVCGGVLRGGGECKTWGGREKEKRRGNAPHFVTGYHRLISHEHLRGTCLVSLLGVFTLTPPHALTCTSRLWERVLFCFLFFSAAWKQLQGQRCFQKVCTWTYQWKECVSVCL